MSKRIAWSGTALLLIGLWGCSSAPSESVDILYFNGTIITADAKFSVANSLAVTGERIVAVGDDQTRALRPKQTVDLQGATMLPGFIDTHTHIEGQPERYIDLTEVGSIEQMQAAVATKAAALAKGEWITGYGWSEDSLTEGRKPNRADLDHAAPDHPVVLTRAGAHSAVANSAALIAAGLTAVSPDPDQGMLEREADGTLTGIIRERQDLLLDLVPEAEASEVRASLLTNLQAQFSLGITSIVQAMSDPQKFERWEELYSSYRGQLPRAAMQVSWEHAQALSSEGKRSGTGDEHFRIGAVKVFVDGGFTGPAAYTKEPYKGESSYRGSLTQPEADFARLFEDAHRAGWQLGLHAIGDAAIELSVAQLSQIIEQYPRSDHRHYLNHFTIMPSADTMRSMASHEIHITQQPNFTYTLEGRYRDYLDGERLSTNNPLRSPMDHGVHLALSSDILPMGPMLGIYAAVSRKGASGTVYAADEALSVAEAIQGYTLNGALLTFEERDKGSLEVGKFADFVILEANPMSVSEAQLKTLRVLQTWLGGRRVYVRAE
ncbi:MAG: amidohydrolase [Pseudomonadales bacterium]